MVGGVRLFADEAESRWPDKRMHCPHCSKPAPSSSAKCPHCGERLHNVAQRSGFSVTCPHCAVATELVELARVTVDMCRTCGSIWFDKMEFETVRDRVNEDAERSILHAVRAFSPENATAILRPYVSCPVCTNPLLKRRHPYLAGVVAHQCSDHGAWIERRHLVHVLQAIAEQGAAVVTQREVKASEEQERRQLQDWKDAVQHQRHVLDQALMRTGDWFWF